MFVFEMHKMIYSFFFFLHIIFCQYHETKFVCFSSNLRGLEFVIFFFCKICHYFKKNILVFFGLLYPNFFFCFDLN